MDMHVHVGTTRNLKTAQMQQYIFKHKHLQLGDIVDLTFSVTYIFVCMLGYH